MSRPAGPRPGQDRGDRPDGGPGDEPLTLYLDIDGVLTTTAFQRRAGQDRLDPAAVAVVAALVRRHGARVVVSSTWRVADCRPTLVAAGLPEACFHPDWRTAILATSRDPATGAMLAADAAGRGGEISDHAGRNGVTRYLVLDDVDVGPAHAGHHVRPDPETGITAAEGALAGDMVARQDAGRGDRRAAPPDRDGMC